MRLSSSTPPQAEAAPLRYGGLRAGGHLDMDLPTGGREEFPENGRPISGDAAAPESPFCVRLAFRRFFPVGIRAVVMVSRRVVNAGWPALRRFLWQVEMSVACHDGSGEFLPGAW